MVAIGIVEGNATSACRSPSGAPTSIPRRNAASGVSLRSTRCATSRATRRMRSVSRALIASTPSASASSSIQSLIGPPRRPRGMLASSR